MEFRVPKVRYVGHLITNSGIKVDPEKVRVIVDMPAPKDESGVKHILGVVQYVAKFIPNLSEVTAPLCTLLQPDMALVCTSTGKFRQTETTSLKHTSTQYI